LHEVVWVEDVAVNTVIDLAAKPRQFPTFAEHFLPYELTPDSFILAATQETFNLPDDICAEYRLSSSLARAGLNAALAMWCDPGWHGSQLTLELKNWTQAHDLLLRSGMKIGQMIFHRVKPVPEERSYRTVGSYNNTQGPSVRG